MSEHIKSIFTQEYIHIDNGGFDYKIKTDFIGDGTCSELTVCASYFGYPSVSTSILFTDTNQIDSLILMLQKHKFKVLAELET